MRGLQFLLMVRQDSTEFNYQIYITCMTKNLELCIKFDKNPKQNKQKINLNAPLTDSIHYTITSILSVAQYIGLPQFKC